MSGSPRTSAPADRGLAGDRVEPPIDGAMSASAEHADAEHGGQEALAA